MDFRKQEEDPSSFSWGSYWLPEMNISSSQWKNSTADTRCGAILDLINLW